MKVVQQHIKFCSLIKAYDRRKAPQSFKGATIQQQIRLIFKIKNSIEFVFPIPKTPEYKKLAELERANQRVPWKESFWQEPFF
jgi:hypothetical protein